MMRSSLVVLGASVVTAGWLGCSAAGSESGGGAAAGGSAAFAGLGQDGSAAASGAPSGGGAGGGGGSGAGGSGAGGSGATGPQDGGLADVQFVYDGDVPPAEACAAVTVDAQLVPLDLYVVLDRSGSMVNSALGPHRWPPVRDALNQFYQSAQAQGIGIALTMFAHPTQNQCAVASYQTPLVAMAPLPGNASGHAITLQNTMNQYAPILGVGTPTASAMTGALNFAKSYKNSNPGRTVAIVLATDGLPGAAGCSGETAALVQSAITSGFATAPSIRTFVIGIDPDSTMSTNLNNWANAGGGQFFDVATAGGSAQFLQAMKNIQGALLGCSFTVPKLEAGVIEPGKVKVVFTPSSGPPVELPRVMTAAACSGPGWYYDNNTTPSTIELCPSSCATAQADANAKINIELGCLGS